MEQSGQPSPSAPEELTLQEAETALRRMAGAGRSITAAQLSVVASRPAREPKRFESVVDPPAPTPGQKSIPTWDGESLRAVLESVPDAVIAADSSGTIVLVNRQTETLFGYDRDELLGRPVEILLPERYRAGHVAQRARYFADPQVRPMGPQLDLWGRRRDGREFPVEISLSPLRTATGLLVTTTVRDISIRKHAEVQLQNAETRYRTLVEEIPAVTFMAALDESAAAISELYVSPQIETLLGFTQQEWLEDPILWYRQLHRDDRERWHVEFAETCSTAAPFDSVYRFLARDGREVWVHGHAKVVRDREGRPLYLQGIAYDITEGKRAEEAMALLNTTLEKRVAEAVAKAEQRAEELARSNEALDRFAYIASHDLREPLRTIMRYMQLLSKRSGDTLDEAAREHVSKAITGAREMNQLISDLHMHSRIGRKREFTPIDCSDVLAEACRSLRATIDESGAVVTADPLPTVPGIRPELLLLFQNLIQNAVKFRAEAAPQIHVGARHDGEGWLFWFRDNGMGIEAQYLERIFGIGERLHGRKIPGTGFGLANCRKIVTHHGGAIRAESEPGAGSTFFFTLRAV